MVVVLLAGLTPAMVYAVAQFTQTFPSLVISQPELTFNCTALSYTITNVNAGSGYLNGICPIPAGGSPSTPTYAFIISNAVAGATVSATFTVPQFLDANLFYVEPTSAPGVTNSACGNTALFVNIQSGVPISMSSLGSTGTTLDYCIHYTIPQGATGSIAGFTITWNYN